MLLRCRQFEFTFPRPAMVMGIVNITPDSFSDGGKFLDAQAAVEHALRLVEEGAEIIDVGGESTRPGATPVSEAEEMRRVIPVIEELAWKLRARDKGKTGDETDPSPWPSPLGKGRGKSSSDNPESKSRNIGPLSPWGGEREKPWPIIISIDTMKPAVARVALRAGASIINDVAANREDEQMWRVVADAGAGYVVMHTQGMQQT